MKKLREVDFLIFDLGNVIIDIDIPLTVNLLKQNLQDTEHGLAEDFFKSQIHADFETGRIADLEFRDSVRKAFSKEWEDQLIDEMWNSLLVRIPQERIDMLRKLKSTYKICMLSNTNSIHFKKVEEILLRDCGVHCFSSIFDRLFLSYEMGYKKPDPAIYHEVIKQLNSEPHRCLFFDDLEDNLKAAEKAGLRTYHVDHPNAWMGYFKNNV
ncbi:HAD family phosphatase [Litoribacter ruber]|uniref:HAD family hydrolase n=1 Tax=Litoribacter ruber TaxID=702568 RepID=UPI001BDA8868|nr:HAD family phosphatase [Litoribacter ruber]MBT0810606.1 HAD family phosphatase [Litoribacter ruber]